MRVLVHGDPCPDPGLERDLVAAALRAVPEECCGLVLRLADGTLSLQPCRNVAGDPRNGFTLHPGDLARALARCDAGAQAVAVFHSHPAGPDRLSAADLAGVPSGLAQWLITPAAPRPRPATTAAGRDPEQRRPRPAGG